MIEREQDLWDVDADAVVITTNGFVKNNGEAVMGRGCAREAVERWPTLAKILGDALLRDSDDHVRLLAQKGRLGDNPNLVSFPVKQNWWEEAPLWLVTQSVTELVDLADSMGWKTVVLPRPGCGNGKLEWDGPGGVRELLVIFLDDRFVVVSPPRVKF